MKTFVPQDSEPRFIILNEYCQVFCGLKKGYPSFSDNMDDAKPVWNHEQFKKVQYGTNFILEKLYI
jgi:hypothetical protein